MNKDRAAQKAYEYLDGTYHCAEAVAFAVAEEIGLDNPRDMARAAAAFGGGIGKSHEELCGALSGALIVLGFAEGRREPSCCWQDMADRATELRTRFRELHGCTQCKELLDIFGEQVAMKKCRELTAQAASILADMLRTSPRFCKCRKTAGCC